MAENDIIGVKEGSRGIFNEVRLNDEFTGILCTIKETTQLNYTLQVSDINAYIRCDNAFDINVIIPSIYDVPLPLGTVITLEQKGLGVIAVSPAASVTLNGRPRTIGQYAVVQIIHVALNVWTIIGGV